MTTEAHLKSLKVKNPPPLPEVYSWNLKWLPYQILGRERVNRSRNNGDIVEK